MKTCFVIMPVSDVEGYPVGHFKRVYEHLIRPACEKAGFCPIRADEVQQTNMIMLDILDQIIKSDMAICDLSSKNPNVMYELGVRQAFDLPVTIIKDRGTSRVFDIQGLRDLEYSEDLRIDLVEQSVKELAQTIRNTYENKNGNSVNSLIKLLNIEPAKLMDKKVEISQETSLILESLANINKKINELDESKTKYVPATHLINLANWTGHDSDINEKYAGRSYIQEKDAVATESVSNGILKTGRNEPCYCGSGKKYKNCHGKEELNL